MTSDKNWSLHDMIFFSTKEKFQQYYLWKKDWNHCSTCFPCSKLGCQLDWALHWREGSALVKRALIRNWQFPPSAITLPSLFPSKRNRKGHSLNSYELFFHLPQFFWLPVNAYLNGQLPELPMTNRIKLGNSVKRSCVSKIEIKPSAPFS